MAVIPKYDIGLLQLSASLDVDEVLTVDENIGNLGIAQERFERPEPEYLIEQIGLDLFFLRRAQRHLAIGNNFEDQAGNRFPGPILLHIRKPFEVEFRDQR